MYGVHYFADMWQRQCSIFISYKVSFLSATKDTRPGRTALPLCNNKNPWRQFRPKQPIVMIKGGVARLQPSGNASIQSRVYINNVAFRTFHL